MRPNFYVLEYFNHTLATLEAPTTSGTAKHLVRSGPLAAIENGVQIHYNWRRYPSSNWYEIDRKRVLNLALCCGDREQEAQLMLTTGSTRLAVSRGQQTWYHSTCNI